MGKTKKKLKKKEGEKKQEKEGKRRGGERCGSERNKAAREEGFVEASNSVRHSAQQATVLSKALHHRNVIIFPFQRPLKGLEQCNWRNKLFVTLDVSRVLQ